MAACDKFYLQTQICSWHTEVTLCMFVCFVGWRSAPCGHPSLSAGVQWEQTLHVRVSVWVLRCSRGASVRQFIREWGEKSVCVCVNIKVIYTEFIWWKYSKNSKIVKYYNLKQLFSIVINLKYNLFLWSKLNFQHYSSSVSHDPSENILIYWFAAQEIFLFNVENSCAT